MAENDGGGPSLSLPLAGDSRTSRNQPQHHQSASRQQQEQQNPHVQHERLIRPSSDDGSTTTANNAGGVATSTAGSSNGRSSGGGKYPSSALRNKRAVANSASVNGNSHHSHPLDGVTELFQSYRNPFAVLALVVVVMGTMRVANSRDGMYGTGRSYNDQRHVTNVGAPEPVDGDLEGDGDGGSAEGERSAPAVRLSKSLENLAPWDDAVAGTDDVAYFWHVPRSGGRTMMDVMGTCVGLVIASDAAAKAGRDRDDELEVVRPPEGDVEGGGGGTPPVPYAYVNVDTTTPAGIHRAKTLGLVPSGLADAVVTPHLHAGAALFDGDRRGRMFALLRHPVERAASMFHHLAVAEDEPFYDPSLALISIETYAKSRRVEHNWMVRHLSNEVKDDLTERHLQVAMETLRSKCLVGFLDGGRKAESVRRFGLYFGWKALRTNEGRECEERLVHWGWSNKLNHPTVEEDSLAWRTLYRQNELDMRLYTFAMELFDETQGKMFTDDGFIPNLAGEGDVGS